MRKFSLLLLSGLFLGSASFVERNKCDPQTGNDSSKSPRIKTVDWAYLNAADRSIANDGTTNYIISSMQKGEGRTDELPDDFENVKKLNQRVGYKTNYPDIIIKKNELNKI
jgi:hypothetical protein